MKEDFQIPITLNGQELSFSACLVPSGYITKIVVNIYGEKIMYEPDEEGQYRALINNDAFNNDAKINIELLKEIANTIQSVRN